MKKLILIGSNGYLGSSFLNLYKNQYNFEIFLLFNQKLEDINFDGIDIVLNCLTFVHQKIEHPYENYHEINVDYPVKLANSSKQKGVKQFVFINTIAVYGEDKEKLDENTTYEPITQYGKSKLETEKQLLELNDDSFIVSIIRQPIIYSKNAPGNIRSLIKLIDRVLILPFGAIQNQRNFVYVGNLCAMMDCIIQTKSCGIFLVSDDVPLSITKLIVLIAKAKNKKIYLLHVWLFEKILLWVKPSIYQRLFGSLIVDNSQTKAILNFKNPCSVDDGIQIMVQGEKE